MRCYSVCILLISIFLVVALTPAKAFRVLPMVYDLSASGEGARTTIRIENTGANPLPVEIFAQKRMIQEDGSETREPADDDFLIFPPQAVIPPNSAQALRIQYIGKPDIENSVGYVITVAQLPIDFEEEEGAGVRFAFEFGTSVNVIPKGAKASVKVIGASVNQGGKAEALVENKGKAYTRLTYGRWVFKNEDGVRYTLEGDPLREMLAQPLIQPQTKRRIAFDLPEDFSLNGLSIHYESIQ